MIIPTLFLFCRSAIPTSSCVFMFFIPGLCHFFSSRCMLELRFAITQQQKCVLTDSQLLSCCILVYGPMTQVLPVATLAILAQETSICSNTKSNLFWVDDKASSPCLKTRGTHRSQLSKNMDSISLLFTHSYLIIFTHIYVRDLPQPFKCLVWLTAQHIPTVFLIQWSWVIISCHC